MAKSYVQFSVRTDQDMHEWLKDQADRNHRTLNAQVIHLLEWARREADPARVWDAPTRRAALPSFMREAAQEGESPKS